MNEVERIYRLRDQKIERGEIHIILPEEEHRKHQKDGTFPGPAAPENEFEPPYPNAQDPIEPRPRQSVAEEPQPHATPGFQFNDQLTLHRHREETETDRYCICGKQNDN
jgi:hypothetical protein